MPRARVSIPVGAIEAYELDSLQRPQYAFQFQWVRLRRIVDAHATIDK